MTTTSSAQTPATRWHPASVALIAAALVLLVALALRLTAVAVNPWLSSDVLFSELFAADVLGGKYPSSGWSFGGAPSLFPVYLIHFPALVLAGPGGLSYAIYVVVLSLALAALVAASARWWSGTAAPAAWLAGVLTVDVALALQFLPQHAEILWLLPVPGFHGGALLNGLALVALAGRLTDATSPAPSRRLWLLTGVVLLLGVLSDAVLLVQFVVPLVAVLWWRERRGDARQGGTRNFILLCGLALVGVALARLGLRLTQWGFYYPLWFRHTPTPTVLWQASVKFVVEVGRELGPRAWGWGVGIVAWLVLASADCWRASVTARGREQASGPTDTRRLALHGLVALSSGAMIAVLVGSGFWKDWSNVRYLLNVLVLPLAVVAIIGAQSEAVSRLLASARAAGLAALALIGATVALGVTMDSASWKFQPTAASRDYAEIVRSRGLQRGLAGYWQANLLNTLAEPDGSPGWPSAPRLNQLKPDGHAYFWCNNAFWYFAPPEPDGTLRWPPIDFIVTEGLDRAKILERFGTPTEIVKTGAWEVFIYDAAGQERIRAALQPEVIEKLGPQRLRGLHPAD